MPYITQEKRESLSHSIDVLVALLTNGDGLEGKLNYTISSIISGILKIEGINYTNLNKLIGVLECAKLELYRCVASPYEDLKLEENGDVYFGSQNKGVVV
tara:strand:- start:395 stop:694 length:300 start_codon:yes stop_codon:yes gene_type:complete